MLLAGLLLKLGTVGFFRLIFLIKFNFLYFWYFISFLGIVLASLVCSLQRDSKSLAAYSSVTHISFVLISLVLLFSVSKSFSVVLIISHGYISTLIFFLIGEYFHFSNSRIIYYFRGVFNSSIVIVFIFSLVLLSNRAVPPSISFFSEFGVVTRVYFFFGFSFFLLLIYFFVSFYYSLFLLTNSLSGKSLYFQSAWLRGYSFNLIFISFNLF